MVKVYLDGKHHRTLTRSVLSGEIRPIRNDVEGLAEALAFWDPFHSVHSFWNPWSGLFDRLCR